MAADRIRVAASLRAMAPLVRTLRSGDDAALADIWEQAFIGDGHVRVSGRAVIRDVADTRRRGVVFVATEDEVLLGGVVLASQDTLVADRTRGELEVQRLGVARSGRGRGIAEKLMRAVMHEAHARGADALVLWTRPSMLAAQRLYERIGFERLAERDFPRDGRTMLVYRYLFPAAKHAAHG